MQSVKEIGPEAQYAQYLRSGRFMIQRCRKTGQHIFYPRVAEPGTGHDDLEWVQASGFGVVYATTVVRRKNDSESYNVALIDLAEGPRVMSRVTALEPGGVKIGMPVEAFIEQQDEQSVLMFKSVEGS